MAPTTNASEGRAIGEGIDLKHLTCNMNDALLVALEKMRESGKRIIFVIDDELQLRGLLTDGDVRRRLLEGYTLNDRVSDLIAPTFTYARSDEPQDQVLAKLTEKIKTVPIVDERMRLVDYVQLDKAAHLPIASPNLRGNEFNYLVEAFLSTWISSSGAYIRRFESEFAQYCGTKHAVAVANGTVALHLAIVASGIGAGDEIIVPDITFAASINAVLHAGATPVIVDVEPDYWTIDPEEIRKAITPRTRAIMPVHIYGQPCDMAAIAEIAREHGLIVIEDAAEAHGARFAGKVVGGIGDIGCFSFYGNKIVTTGEGGMCVTNSDEIYERMVLLRDHGMSRTRKYWHEAVGFNYRMTNLQGAIGCAQLEKIEETLAARAALERRYRDALSGLGHLDFQKADDTGVREKVTWLVSVMCRPEQRDPYLEAMTEARMDARPFFYPLSAMPIYSQYTFSSRNSTEIAARGLNLPTALDVTDKQILAIRDVLSAT